MEKYIKKLQGHSGSSVYLMKDEEKLFVRKIGLVDRNIERMLVLSKIVSIPKIYKHSFDILDMEYIQGLDMRTYLLHKKIEPLIEFLIDTIDKLSYTDTVKNYEEVYEKKLSCIDYDVFAFTKKGLLDRLPKTLNQTPYHGDFTLDNIIYNEEHQKFYLIDPLTSEYDSFMFDIAKLNQDLKCGWFVRNDCIDFTSKIKILDEVISNRYENESMNLLTIPMLLRVYPYCNHQKDRDFIIRSVNKLWT